jgi:mannitol operon transcriptional antiterminator
VNKRQYGILMKLLRCSEIMLGCLTNEYSVSERTIRNDVQVINCLIDRYALIDISGGSVQISFTGNYDELISHLMLQSNYYAYKLSPKERKSIASLIILNNHEFTTIAYLADRMSVSRNTILNELADIRNWFKECNLQLGAQTNKGLRVIGEEEDIRNAIFKIINNMDEVDNDSIFKYLIEKEIIGDLDRKYIENLIKSEEKINGLDIADFSFNAMVNYIVVVANRIIKGKCEEGLPTQCFIESKTHIAKNIMVALGERYGFYANDNEVNQVTAHLASCSYIRNPANEQVESINMQMLVTGFIYEVCKELEISDNISYDTYKFLIDHMETMTSRLKQKICLVNPFRKELEESYPKFFRITKQHIHPIEKALGLIMGTNEIAYIVMHIVAAVEKNKNIKLPINAVIVCSTGLCTALLLQAKLKQRFDICVVDVISAHNLDSYNLKDIDIIISTTLVECRGVKSVLITPMLHENDIAQIHKSIQKIISNRLEESGQNRELIKKIADYAKAVSDVFKNDQKDTSEVAFEMALINKKYSVNAPSSAYKNSCKFLYEIIDEDDISLDISVENWQEAVQRSGELLKTKGYIEQRYIDKMINNVQVNGPYIVFNPGVAFAHASPVDGARKLAVSIIRLKEEVKFNHKVNDPVKFIFCLSVADYKSHINAFFNLVKMIGNKEIFNIFNHASHPKEIIEVIRCYELNG